MIFSSSNTAEEHKNDGFLKSVWHKITDHSGSSTTSGTVKDDSSKDPKDKDSGAAASQDGDKKV